MSEIYWITRLDSINGLLSVILIIGLIATVFFTIAYASNGFETDDDFTEKNKKTLKHISIITVIVAIMSTFIPTQKDMLLIYGVGGTIDYIKSNETAKQLPDKAVQALDKIISEYIGEPSD